LHDSDKTLPSSDTGERGSFEKSLPSVFGLLLIDGFALMSYASVLEPFRAANVLSGRELYRYIHVSLDGRPTRASNGASILADGKVGDPIDCDTLFVFAAGDPSAFDDRRTFTWLRRMALQGVRMAGVSGGPFLLARAGLLDGHRATIHWEHQPAFVETFPRVILQSGLYVIDRRRMTCAGGAAGLDLAIEQIERDHGHALAVRVGEWFIQAEPRAADRPQRASFRDRYGVTNNRVLKVLANMEECVDDPAPRSILARIAGVSPRQLERLFREHLGTTVGGAYLGIRLDQADELIRQTAMPVTEAALACGFQSPSHFSRTFRARFGVTPSRRREAER
jgi:transcriptional regulator GlxA family with amidase domain